MSIDVTQERQKDGHRENMVSDETKSELAGEKRKREDAEDVADSPNKNESVSPKGKSEVASGSSTHSPQSKKIQRVDGENSPAVTNASPKTVQNCKKQFAGNGVNNSSGQDASKNNSPNKKTRHDLERGNALSSKRKRQDAEEKTSGAPDGVINKRQRLDGDSSFPSPFSAPRIPRMGVASGISSGADSSVLLTPTKNAVCALNELRPGLTYSLVSQVGPVHAPLFTISVEVNGQAFRGTGRSKKRAKKSAAEAALRSFVQFKNSEEVAHAMGIGGSHPGNPNFSTLDFTMDVVHNEGGLYNTFAPAYNSETRAVKVSAIPHSQRRAPQEQAASTVRANGTTVRGNSNSGPSVPVKTSAAVKLETLRARTMQPGASPPPPCILSPADKGPVTMLNELRPGLKYECLSENGEQYAKFTMSVLVDGQQFKGMGPSKKLGKAAAAKAALAKMFNITFSPFASLIGGQGSPASPPSALIASPSLLLKKLAGDRMSMPQTLADHIASLVISKFSALAASLPVGQARRKVLSGIVMTGPARLLPIRTPPGSPCSLDTLQSVPPHTPAGDDAVVLCLGTGTKCVGGGHLSESGMALNDTHAEVVARRCLLDFFYSQLEDLVLWPEKTNASIFEPRPTGNGYRVKPGIKFHLYINTAPCGDARIFSPHELGCMQGPGENQVANISGGSGNQGAARSIAPSGVVSSSAPLDRHPNRRARGQLRTKIESGEGTIPVKSSDGIQTWDGVMQGQRLLTMSCSDKVCKWNVVGLQGSLLSHLVEPIYLDSVVLGSLFHPSHLYRAMCGRVEPWIQGLPPPFRLNKPLMALISSPEIRQAGKAPSYSVNWTIGKESPEVINSVTGKDEAGQASRLCKRFFFRRFLRLINPQHDCTLQQVVPGTKLLSERRVAIPLHPLPESLLSMSVQYSTAKDSMGDYQAAKHCLLEAFRKGGLGTWLKKPLEQDQFELMEEEYMSEAFGE